MRLGADTLKYLSITVLAAAKILSGFILLKATVWRFGEDLLPDLGQALTAGAFLLLIATVPFTRATLVISSRDSGVNNVALGQLYFIAAFWVFTVALGCFFLAYEISLYLVHSEALVEVIRLTSMTLPLGAVAAISLGRAASVTDGYRVYATQATGVFLSVSVVLLAAYQQGRSDLLLFYPATQFTITFFLTFWAIGGLKAGSNLRARFQKPQASQVRQVFSLAFPMLITTGIALTWSTLVRSAVIADASPFEAASWEFIRRVSDAAMQVVGMLMLYILYPYLLRSVGSTLSFFQTLSRLVPVLLPLIGGALISAVLGQYLFAWMLNEEIAKYATGLVTMTLLADVARSVFFAFQLWLLATRKTMLFVLLECAWALMLSVPFVIMKIDTARLASEIYAATQVVSLGLIFFVVILVVRNTDANPVTH